MRVLITADTVGGVWTYTQELVTGLVRRGVQVTLVSFGEIPDFTQTRWMEALRNLDFRPTAFGLEWMRDGAEDIKRASDYLLEVIREKRPHLLHLSQYAFGALAVDIPKVVIAHSDVVSWWQAVHEADPPVDTWTEWYRETVQRGLQGASIVIAPSRWMLAQVERHYGTPHVSAVVYNGRSPQLFNPHGTKDDIVLCAGRMWDEAKQVRLLAECETAMPVIIAGAAQHPGAVGEGLDGMRVVCKGVQVKGRQTSQQLQSLYSRAAVYAATSRYEPFGLAPLEAAMSRCAIVANDMPTFREIWGGTAVYFRANDGDSLREVLKNLAADRWLRRHHAELAYQRARRRYCADRMVDEYLTHYRQWVPAGAVAA